MENKGLSSYIQLKDKMSKALTRPLELLGKVNNKIGAIGDNGGLGEAATSANKLGAEIAEINSDSLGDAAAQAQSLVDELSNIRPVEAIVGLKDDMTGKLADAANAAGDLGEAVAGIDLGEAVEQSENLKDELNLQERILQDLIRKHSSIPGILGEQGRALGDNNDALGEANRKKGIFNRLIGKARGLMGGLGKDILKLGAGLVAFISVRGVANQFRNWMSKVTDRQAIEVPMIVSLHNMGATREEIEGVRQMAGRMQDQFAFSDTLFMAGATQLARAVSDVSHIEMLQQSLADMTAGLNGLAATDYDMQRNAQELGQALQGNYRRLERMGIVMNDTQREILKTGDELERIAVLNEIVARNFGGMAEALSNTPEGKLQSMRNAISDINLETGQRLQPIWMSIVSMFYAHMPQISALIGGIGNAAVKTADFFASYVLPILFTVFNTIGATATWVSDTIGNNWSTIEPIVWGLVGAFTALAAIKAVVAIKAGVLIVKKALLTVKQWLLNVALTANPIGIIVTLIGALVGAIMVWINRVGGLRVAWLITMNAILTAWDWVKIGFFTGIHFVLDLWDRLKLGMRTAGTAIANLMGDMRANVLNTLQNMVNSAIGIVNSMISTLNRIPGVNISLIDEVTFGTNAMLANEAERQARNYALDKYRAELAANADSRAAQRAQMQYDARAATGYRMAEIKAAQYAAAQTAAGDYESRYQAFDPMSILDTLGDIADLCKSIADNTGDMAREINIADEDLRYLRDIAEREAVNVITTRVIVPQFELNIAEVKETADIDEIKDKIEDWLDELFDDEPEGVHI